MKPITDAQMFAHQLAAAFDRENFSDTAGIVREAIARTWAHDCRLDTSNAVPRYGSIAALRIVARALYPDDADAATMSTYELAQQATRLHERCAHEHAENVTLTADVARLTEERDDANARAKAACQRADRKTGVCDSLRSEVSDLRAALALAAKANENDGDLRAVEPITQTSPLKVGDRVRLKDATVDELPSTMSDCFRVMIDGEVTPHGDNPGTIIYRSAIAGRVTP